MGEKIKRSIERILGVPILTNARSDIRAQKNFASKKFSAAAEDREETQEIGKQIGILNERREHFELEVKERMTEIEEYKEQKSLNKEKLSRFDKAKYQIQERERLEKDIKDIDNKLEKEQEVIRELMSKAWRGILGQKISDLIKIYRAEYDSLTNKQSKLFQESVIRKLLNKALEEQICPICKTDIDQNQVKRIKENQKIAKPRNDKSDIEDELYILGKKIKALEVFEHFNKMGVIIRKLMSIDEDKIEKRDIKERITEIDNQTKDFDKSEIRYLFTRQEQIIGLIANVEEGLKADKEELNNTKKRLKEMQDRLKSSSGGSLKKEKDRLELSEDLYALLEISVDKYRDQLRKRVEEDASKLFIELTTENDYSGLKINDSYGLTIVHDDGNLIPIRSAGAEHVVALSLLGALQKNAPLQGPLIMDSPFGRLDSGHTAKVVEVLPKMAEQVILLVYESELDPALARKTLKGKLVEEYKLQRKTAKYTLIEKMPVE